MLTFISVTLALCITFFTTEIQVSQRSMVIDQKYFIQFGYPYQYFENETLTDQEIRYRFRIIYVSSIMCLTFIFGVGPIGGPVINQVLLPLPSPPVSLETLISNSVDSENQNTILTAPVVIPKVETIKLTSEQIEVFKKCMAGSITLDEAIFQLRGGSELTDLVAIIGFIILVNWIDSLYGVESFKSVPLPHMDPFGWLSGKYDSKGAGNQQSRYLFERQHFERLQMTAAKSDYGDRFLKPHVINKTIFQNDPRLTKEYKNLIKSNPKLKKAFEALEKQISQGNFKAGREKGLQKWKGSKNIYYMGTKTLGGRIYFKFTGKPG